jgi:hypothetical protein
MLITLAYVILTVTRGRGHRSKRGKNKNEKMVIKADPTFDLKYRNPLEHISPFLSSTSRKDLP